MLIQVEYVVHNYFIQDIKHMPFVCGLCSSFLLPPGHSWSSCRGRGRFPSDRPRRRATWFLVVFGNLSQTYLQLYIYLQATSEECFSVVWYVSNCFFLLLSLPLLSWRPFAVLFSNAVFWFTICFATISFSSKGFVSRVGDQTATATVESSQQVDDTLVSRTKASSSHISKQTFYESYYKHLGLPQLLPSACKQCV